MLDKGKVPQASYHGYGELEPIQNEDTQVNKDAITLSDIRMRYGQDPIPDDSSEDDKKPAAKLKNTSTNIEENTDFLIIDSGADTSTIAGDHWIIDEITERKINLLGFKSDVTSHDVPVGSGITAIDLPDDSTILLKVNEAAILQN